MGKRRRERPTSRSALYGKGAISHGAQCKQHEPEEGRGDAPCACAVTLLEQLAENGHEGGRESCVGDQRADRVRYEKGDLKRVDRATNAEVVLGDDLSDETEDA